MDRDRRLRDHLVGVLRGGNAHMPFAEAVAEFPEAQINTRPPRVDYTFWHLLEHLRITQADILAYLTQADYHAPAWPRGLLAGTGHAGDETRVGRECRGIPARPRGDHRHRGR